MRMAIYMAGLQLLFAGSIYAGGGLGGGGAIQLEQMQLESLRANISRDQFSALVVSGSNDEQIKVNGTPAKITTVNFQSKTVEIVLEGSGESLQLKVDDEQK